jgi:uncharacterized membrane protein YfcA
MEYLIGGTVAFFCGILSALGVGGGGLFMIYLISFAAIEQRPAQLINLLVFIPTALCAVWIHRKHGYIHKKTGCYSALFGLIGVAIGLSLGTVLEPVLLRKLFGLFLAAIGLYELFRK